VLFHDRVPVGGRLRAFGAAVPEVIGADTKAAPDAPPDVLPGRRTNYRRWSNHAWSVVEAGGPSEAGEWTIEDAARLSTIVRRAHDAGLWVRFYTLNGLGPEELSLGWTASYNFGSRDAAELRWRAAIEAGVDFIATDQYETFAAARAASLSR
jgi:glycerophosphoryl diester phosphodiesterase